MSSTVLEPGTIIDPATGSPEFDFDRLWHVRVGNDDHNTFEGVATALSMVIPGVTYEEGLEFADRIHKKDEATVWSGMKEVAELYHEQLGSLGLSMLPLEQDPE